MITKKLFIITILISLIGHITVLGLTGLMDISGSLDNDTLFTINLEEKSDLTERTIETKETFPAALSEDTVVASEIKDEDTVNLDSSDSRYRQYLMKVKKNIRSRWSYPDKAYELKEEGTAVVRFSIKEDGKLADSRVIISSGHESLDIESFRVVKSAAPFMPLPKKFDLTKLNMGLA